MRTRHRIPSISCRLLNFGGRPGFLPRGSRASSTFHCASVKVERKISHLMRRRHGGRRARVRGLAKTAADFTLPAAAVNLARLGVLGTADRNGARAADRA